MSKSRGFTLIELMIVVAIIAIIAAIAIPNLLRSRMAANETAAVGACKALAEAEDIYRRTDWNRDGVLEYSLFISGQSSLYRDNEMQEISLVDKAFAMAEGDPGGQNTELNPTTPKAGYCFRVLTSQGPNASGGSKSYISTGGGNPHMTLGYAVSALPYSYDGSGRSTFCMSSTGTIYQKDRGKVNAADTSHLAIYDPDSTYAPSE